MSAKKDDDAALRSPTHAVPVDTLEEVHQSLNLIIIPLLIIAGFCTGVVLVWAEDILVPFVISVFFTYLLRPLVDFLSRPILCCNLPARARCGRLGSIQAPRWMAILLSMILVMALFTGLVVLVIDAMQSFENENLAAYEERTIELANIVLRWLKRAMNVDGSYMLAQIKNEFQLVQMTKSLLIILMNAVAYTFIVMLFVLYMLFEGAANSSSSDALSGDGGGRQIHSVRKQIDTQIQRYLLTKTGISAIVGGLTFLVLGPLLHVKMAHLFGVVTFLANFIPNVGAVIATLLPLPIVMLDPSLSGMAVVLAFVLPTTIHTVVGNIIEPIFFGQQMELHPIVVLLSLSFWFSLWGVAGALLSVPITAVMRIVVSNIAHPYAQFAKNLFEGKLPGTAASAGVARRV